jgi:hypothetical protein
MDFGVCLHPASALELRWPRVRIADPGSQPTPEDSEGEHYRQHRIAKEVAYKISHARGITKASRTAGNRGAEPCTRRVMPRTCRGGQRQVLSPFGRREPGQRVQLPQHKPHPSRHPGAAANEPLMRHQPRLVLLLPPLPSISRWSQLSKFLVWTRTADPAHQSCVPGPQGLQMDRRETAESFRRCLPGHRHIVRRVGVCNCVTRGLTEPRAGSVPRVRSRSSSGNSALARSHWTKTHPSHDLARQR